MGVSVCMSVCLSAGVSRKLGVLDFSKLSASVAYGRVSELVWWRCDMLFVDDVFTSTRDTLLKITYHGQHGFDIAVNRVSPG